MATTGARGERRDADTDRWLSGAIVLALGGMVLVFTGYHLVASDSATVVTLLVGGVPGVLLAVLLGAFGLWLIRRGPSGRHALQLLGWAGVSGLFGLSSAALFVVYESSRGTTVVDAPLVVVNTAAGFVLAGLVVGRYDVRARQYALRRYRDLFENVPVGIFRTTPGGDGRLVEVNPAMVEMVGADDEQELIDERVAEFYVDPSERVAFSDELLEREVVVERESRFQRANGDVFFGSVTAIKHERDGQIYFDGILEDITERRHSQRALERHNERLGVLNDVLRHDVRNDMAVVRARGELLRDRLDDDESKEDLRALLDRVDHVVELTKTARDLAEVASADAGRHESVELAPLLDDEIHTANGSHDGATIAADGELPDVAVRANEMLSSVIRNLLDNAVRHNDSDRPEVTVGVEEDESEVAITVADNGPGIPDAQKEVIFDQGEKGEQTGGTGLGLYLVETLVNEYGGHVEIGDNDPRGAVFRVILPRADGGEVAPSE